MKIIKKLLASVFLGVGLTLATIVNAAPWTFFTSGTLISGTDSSGVFGSAGANLTGQTYSQLYTLDPTLYSTQQAGTYFHNSNAALTGGIATDTVTVNGVSRTFTWDLSRSGGTTFLANFVTQGAGYAYDQAYQTQRGYTADGTWLEGQSSVVSYVNSLNLGLNYDQVWSYLIQQGDQAYDGFQVIGNSGTARFVGTPTCIAINNGANCGANNVPEPGTLALLGMALAGAAAARRKKQRQVPRL